MASEYLCNLVIPGAAKSGTSSLHEALGQHPDICMPERKEPKFFSFDEHFAGGSEAHNTIFSGSKTAKYYGESSQCYFAHQWAIDRIAQTLDDPKIIIILRHPIERLLSQYTWNFKRATEVESLSEAIRNRGETVEYTFDDRINSYRELGGYTAFSRYSQWVPQWQKRFGTSNVLLLRFEDYSQDQAAVLKTCFEFLGVAPSDTAVAVHKNATATTTTRILPRYIRFGADMVPGGLKSSFLYSAARARIKQVLTPQPNTEIADVLRRRLETDLEEDIAFHREVPKPVGWKHARTA